MSDRGGYELARAHSACLRVLCKWASRMQAAPWPSETVLELRNTILFSHVQARMAVRAASSRALDHSRSQPPPGAGCTSVAGCTCTDAGFMHAPLLTRPWRSDRAAHAALHMQRKQAARSTRRSSAPARITANKGSDRSASSRSKQPHPVLLVRHSCRSVKEVTVSACRGACGSGESGARSDRNLERVRAYRLLSSSQMMSPCVVSMRPCADPMAIARDTSESM